MIRAISTSLLLAAAISLSCGAGSECHDDKQVVGKTSALLQVGFGKSGSTVGTGLHEPGTWTATLVNTYCNCNGTRLSGSASDYPNYETCGQWCADTDGCTHFGVWNDTQYPDTCRIWDSCLSCESMGSINNVYSISQTTTTTTGTTVCAFTFGDSCTRCGSSVNPLTGSDDALLSSTFTASSSACASWCQLQISATCCHYMDYDVNGSKFDACSEVEADGTTSTVCFCGAYSGGTSSTPKCSTVGETRYGADCV